jgi:histidine phosphotransferase ChpT
MPECPETRLARLLAARLCHDLSGAVGGLTGTLDLIEHAGDTEMLDMARETGVALRQRLRLLTAAWGGPTDGYPADAIIALLAGAPVFPRVRFAAEGLAPDGPLPAAIVPIALNAALLAAEALPRGGMVHLSGDAGGLVVLPDGPVVAWPPALLAQLGGAAEPLAGGPRQVVAPFLLALVAEAGWRASLGLGAGPVPGPLVLGPD